MLIIKKKIVYNLKKEGGFYANIKSFYNCFTYDGMYGYFG